jgi:hypothetical protein
MALGDGWYLVGPLIAFAVIGVLAAVLRRALGRDRARPAPPPALPPADEDYGLLRVAALADRAAVAAGIRRALRRAGIRSTVSIGLDGLIRVLVFPDDAHRARRLLNRAPLDPDD